MNGAIPASDWYHSEIHAQLEKSISRTPAATQWVGGLSLSPFKRRNKEARPANRTAEDPIQIPTAVKYASIPRASGLFDCISEVEPIDSITLLCSLVR